MTTVAPPPLTTRSRRKRTQWKRKRRTSKLTAVLHLLLQLGLNQHVNKYESGGAKPATEQG
ncbi:hypothetical protein A2U01_0026385 [Trifolium medium]|uniref:Uncharacterized protein n=1 Tax=Trifolium medium TaxID=97028 RepID=A0A392P0U9_9FABA|nr:hypothetical protein [Trifolium medium]